MCRENPLWGAPRIHGELLKLGIDIGETSVGKYMVRRRKPPSQTWRTFLENHVKSMVSVDFFTVPTIPRYLLRDRDGVFGDDFTQQVQEFGIKVVLAAPRSPWQRAYIERVIGSIWRECLDHVIIVNEAALRRILGSI